MSCPIPKENVDALKQFISLCKACPSILHLPDLSFLKEYIESLGGVIPAAPKEAPKPDEPPKASAPPPEPEQEEEDEIMESDVELDMEGVVAPDTDSTQEIPVEVGEIKDDDKDEWLQEKRSEAVRFFADGKYPEAAKAYTEAISVSPGSAMLYAKRGQTFLVQKMPNACIRDCDKALELNPDCAAAYKFRGRARRLLGDFLKAAEDLRSACKLDFDEQADEWLKEVTPNARKIEEHNRKYERLHAEQKIRQARKARAKRQTESNASAPPPGSGVPPDFAEMFKDPELVEGLMDPDIYAAFEDIRTNPANLAKYQGDPKVGPFLSKALPKLFETFLGQPGQ